MKIPKLFKDLEFVGQIDGDRRTYFAFKGEDYLLVSANDRGGFNVSVIDGEIPELIRKKFGGKRVTGKRLAQGIRRPDLFADGFSFLNALYVMAASGAAKKLIRREGKAMVFKIKAP